MPDFIKLPSERVEQLRLLSKQRDMPIADLIAEFIRDQISKGNLTPDLPTIEVRRTEKTIEIDFDGFVRVLDHKLAAAYAVTLRWYSKPKAAGMHSAIVDLAQDLSGAHHVGISRQGVGIKVTGDNGKSRVLAASVARDLADIIEARLSAK